MSRSGNLSIYICTSPILPIIANWVNGPSPGWFVATYTGNEGFYHGRSISTHNPAWREEDAMVAVREM